MTSHTKWPPEDVERLKRLLIDENMPIDKIGLVLGKSRQAVKEKIQRLGIARKPSGWNDERISRLKRLWAEGKTGGQIAAELRVSRNSVIGKVHRLGLNRNAGEFTTQRLAVKRANAQRKREKKREGTFVKKPSLLSKLLELPLPADDPDDVATTTVIDREPHQCSWVIGDPKDMNMCGAEIVPGLSSPWCARHARRGLALPSVQRPGEGHFVLQPMSVAIDRKNARKSGALVEFLNPVKEPA